MRPDQWDESHSIELGLLDAVLRPPDTIQILSLAIADWHEQLPANFELINQWLRHIR